MNNIEYNKAYSSNRFGDFTVIDKVNDPNKKRYYKIKFILTGTVCEARADHILSGQVKDPYYPILYGVGYSINGGVKYHPLYPRWHNMLSRCYNTKNQNYNAYGGIGVRVDPRWYCFENFVEDVKELPGYYKFLENPDIYQLDKDYLQQNIPHSQRVYSKDTCMWISKYDNMYLQSIENERNINPNQCQYVGVFRKGPHSYNAKIKINGKNHYIGTFSDPIAAANAYNYFYNKYNRNEVVNAVNNVPYMPPEEFIKHNNNVKTMVKVIDKVQRLSSEET